MLKFKKNEKFIDIKKSYATSLDGLGSIHRGDLSNTVVTDISFRRDHKIRVGIAPKSWGQIGRRYFE